MGKEEEKEKKPPLLKLIQESGDLLGSRYVLELVEAARSPKAVDDHFVKLGWSNDTARKARNVARIFQYYPEEWKTLKENDINQTEYHFRDSEKINLDLLDGYSLVCHNRFAIGEESVDISSWPEFLRGLSLKREGGYSYDACFAEGSNFPPYDMGQQSHRLPDPFEKNRKTIKNKMLKSGFDISRNSNGLLYARDTSGCQHIGFLDLQIDTSFYQSAFLDSADTPKLYSRSHVYHKRPDKQLEEVHIALGYDVNAQSACEMSCGILSLCVTNKRFPIEVEMKIIFDVLTDTKSKQLYLQGDTFNPVSVYSTQNFTKLGEKYVPWAMKTVCEFMEKQLRIAESFHRSSPDVKDRSRKILSKLFGLDSLNYDGSILDLFLN